MAGWQTLTGRIEMTETSKMALFFVFAAIFYISLMAWAHKEFVG